MKLTTTTLLETSKFLATQAGQQLQEFIIYVSDFASQTLRILRNNITFADNVNCSIVNATFLHEKAQVIASSGRPLTILHATTSTATAISCLVWAMNSQNQLEVTATFKGAPTGQQSVVLILVYG